MRQLGWLLLLLLASCAAAGDGETAALLGGEAVDEPAPPSFSPEEKQHIVSVTVRLYCSTPSAVIYYTLDGTTPNLNSLSATSGESLLIDSIGETTVQAFSHITTTHNGSVVELSSDVVQKKYDVLARCLPPKIIPGGGTFAGSVTVSLVSDTPGARILYSLDNSPPRESEIGSSTKALLGTDSVVLASSATLTAVAVKANFAPSALSKQSFSVLPKVDTPQFSPSQSVFAVSATVTISCVTTNATIYYTTDGSLPTQSSYRLDPSLPQIVLDQTGSYTVKAFATADNMLQSDISTKFLTVLPRALTPVLDPPPGTYVNEISVCFSCFSASSPGSDIDISTRNRTEGGNIYYTLDGHSTPSDKSSHVECGGCVALNSPSTVHLRAYLVVPNKSPSSIITGDYIVIRPPYDEHPVNPNATLQVRPDISIYVVEKNLPYSSYSKSSYCGKRNVRGRLVVLSNPVGHFDVMEPVHGCGGGLELPSISGRANWMERSELIFGVSGGGAGSDGGENIPLPQYESYYSPHQVSSLSSQDISVWKEEYAEANANGCEVVSNAGFFNVSSGACFGDLISAGRVVQTSEKHNVNFGIRNGQFVTGYVTSDEILGKKSASNVNDEFYPFDTLVSGLGWLVRHGEHYVDESFHNRPPLPSSRDDETDRFSSMYGEDMSSQSSGDTFSTLLSARTALGHDSQGRLLLLQVEGESWVRGMDLNEFASFAVELGFHSAINLDGGGSATMTVNHSLISEPSWQCTPEDISSSLLSPSAKDRTYCEKRVSSITCFHSMPPPIQVQRNVTNKSGQQDSETLFPSQSPPLNRPDENKNKESSTFPSNEHESNSTLHPFYNIFQLEAKLRSTQSSETKYKSLCVALSFMLLVSLISHVIRCWKMRDMNQSTDQDVLFQWQPQKFNGNSELSPESSRHRHVDIELGASRQNTPSENHNVAYSEKTRNLETDTVANGYPPSQLTGGASRHSFKSQPPHHDDEDISLENYGLPDSLDFNEFDDSDDDENNVEGLQYKVPSDMAYINKPVDYNIKNPVPSTLQDDEDIENEAEEETSLLSPQQRENSKSGQSRKKKSKDKKSRSDKKNKRMSMDFTDRNYD